MGDIAALTSVLHQWYCATLCCTMLVVGLQVFVLLQLRPIHSTKTAHYLWGARTFSFSGPDWPLSPGIRFRIDFIWLNQQFVKKNSSKHFSSKHFCLITPSIVSNLFLWINLFYYAYQSPVGHLFCNWRYINNLLIYSLTICGASYWCIAQLNDFFDLFDRV